MVGKDNKWLDSRLVNDWKYIALFPSSLIGHIMADHKRDEDMGKKISPREKFFDYVWYTGVEVFRLGIYGGLAYIAYEWMK